MSLSRRIRVWVPRAVRDRSRRPRPVPNHPVVEVLESRCTPSTFVVATTDDSGAGSLRAAILQTNAAAGPDHIAFAIPTSDARFEDANHNRQFDPGDFWSIRPTAALPAISDRVTLDGWSQGGPGYHGQPLVELDGRNAGPGADGLVLADHRNSTLRGLIINRFHRNGVVIDGGGGHELVGNFIGTDAAGQRARGNHLIGVLINASSDNSIGGTGPGQGNLISGNDFQGIRISGAASTGNRIVANLVGTNRSGVAAVANGSKVEDGDGIRIEGGRLNIIGGTTAAERNVLSGNHDDGIDLRDGASDNMVQGNWIGIDASGRNPLGNGADGIFLQDASRNLIGGLCAEEGNVIGANGFNGVFLFGDSHDNVIANNFIGTNPQLDRGLGNSTRVSFADGIFLAQFDRPQGPSNNTILRNTIAFNRDSAVAMDVSTSANFGGNRIRENSIFGNGGVAIDLGSDGITPNDSLDLDGGPNGLQNFPVLNATTLQPGGNRTVTGTLDSTPSTTFRIEFFASSAAGEGAVYLGFALVTTDAFGHAIITFTFAPVTGMPFITVTATNHSTGDTSEFSAAVS
jgi:Right handed beta helix region